MARSARSSGGGAEPGRGSRRKQADPTAALLAVAERLEARLAAVKEQAAAPPTSQDGLVRHWQRWGPLYAFGVVLVLMVTFFPTLQPDQQQQAGQITPLGAGDAQAVPLDGAAASSDGVQSAIDAAVGATAAAAGSSEDDGAPQSPAQDGVTRGGFECTEGVRQIPWSGYAAPCIPNQGSSNAGATYRGVTEDTIRIVRRISPDTVQSQALALATEQAGFASAEVNAAVRKVWVEYFNNTFELYGRRVELIDWEMQFGSATEEAQSKGKENACLDANVIVNDLNAFGVLGGSQPFSECAAERGLMVFTGGPYFPETWYRGVHPYIWNTVPNCETISNTVVEYIYKRLAGDRAVFAGDPDLRRQERRFGTLVPNNDHYQLCTNNTVEQLQSRGVQPSSRYNYTLDITRFPDEGARAAIRFKADGVTTVVLASDPIIPQFVTSSATNQSFFPEWFIIGTATQDLDAWARTWDQRNVDGSLFGLSQLGSDARIFAPDGEMAETYRRATGTRIPQLANGDYFTLTHTFNLLQSAGPNLTPESIAEGAFSLPPGGAPHYPVGEWSFRDGPDGTPGGRTHTAISDAREVYWDGSATSFDGRRGAYIETYGGQRFRMGQWPEEPPPIPRR